MRSEEWHLTEDVEEFLDRAGDFLRSRPALHNTPLTTIEKLRKPESGTEATLLGRLETADGEVRAVLYRPPTRRLGVTRLSPEQAGTLATYLADLGLTLTGITAEDGTADAFTEAWQRHTGATAVLHQRWHLYRLGELTPPDPFPAGRGRRAGGPDLGDVIRMCGEFCESVGETPVPDSGNWAGTRFADRHFTFWETPDGTPASIAAATTMVAGMVRIDPVYTPAPLRGRGYAAAVTAEISRTALAAGATDVVLYTDPANPTSNALYRRLGYDRITDLHGYHFT
ncbi:MULTISPECIES: GNAT family N-acetyltransferase [Streptomyces]|uniref:N-acetyltransferase n=1 Tax=Streptomyces tsukubensis (strain DSM 42081 / NBRC 108919 / NRRL 18488 / 9993) TaxID=1114943 RepID=I2MZG8_STRT9|nr:MULTISPECIES: GNAT family N-acetyltransferase [Streptomyces]AZK94424.1 N-acetyltransferase [Streptomyces tsukubensis]EIF90165.1 acetyltransferase-like protein [Streptomyces tsukubensis NRRL18488]MYS63445.1 GNAT family N-acetyltransferase [Streptomyces sp. SID5473]QKM69485.1 N-acetyltransferase [Streptomyces tsukubensis NRRL18488]TAI42585.1 GNAT family N-acetyltransferase [Streptomyces tsukubensis]